jgi:hypothetical protein
VVVACKLLLLQLPLVQSGSCVCKGARATQIAAMGAANDPTILSTQILASDKAKMMASVPGDVTAAAEGIVDDLASQLERVQFAIDRKDPDKTAGATSSVLRSVAQLEILQARHAASLLLACAAPAQAGTSHARLPRLRSAVLQHQHGLLCFSRRLLDYVKTPAWCVAGAGAHVPGASSVPRWPAADRPRLRADDCRESKPSSRFC